MYLGETNSVSIVEGCIKSTSHPTFACHATVEKRGMKEPLDQNRVSGKGSSFSLSFDSINAIKSFS